MREKLHGAEALTERRDVKGILAFICGQNMWFYMWFFMNPYWENLEKSIIGFHDETRPAEYLDCGEETLNQNCTILSNGNTVGA